MGYRMTVLDAAAEQAELVPRPTMMDVPAGLPISAHSAKRWISPPTARAVLTFMTPAAVLHISILMLNCAAMRWLPHAA